jgi:hypothetical protein
MRDSLSLPRGERAALFRDAADVGRRSRIVAFSERRVLRDGPIRGPMLNAPRIPRRGAEEGQVDGAKKGCGSQAESGCGGG